MSDAPKPQTLNPVALSVDEIARLLSAAGNRRITVEQVQADVEGGAPVAGDGRLNLVHYTAWLLREVQSR